VGFEPDVWFKQLDVKWVRNWIYGDIEGNRVKIKN
ncbi:unnamed protein product, partial [marine sediment metagenome]